ncbi:MAG: hypothetical protein KKE44_02785 [Proteobacteria bacterium]|nr:hypothetical protein [Pseudomonadota bacterium]MBU1581652.1 hypothetical protein [Pseudomonadota bacterium]MBU2451796.1 hypothetical protein [Pseudomonadota bacterium]MBU2629312.1 hypothetical protein [Pseudomonadota bacterium]
MAKVKRINFELSELKVAELKQLFNISCCATLKEFFINLMLLYKWVLLKKASGKKVGCLDEDGTFHELEMPILDGIDKVEIPNKTEAVVKPFQKKRVAAAVG